MIFTHAQYAAYNTAYNMMAYLRGINFIKKDWLS